MNGVGRGRRLGFAAFGVIGIVVCAVLMLAGCGDPKIVYLTPEEAKARQDERDAQLRELAAPVNKRLPPGCEFRDLGRYLGDPVYAVFCGKTVTTGWSWKPFKVWNHASLTTVRE